MGHTHHWQRPTEFPLERFALAVTDCSTVLRSIGVALAGFDGTGLPLFTSDHVVFNGAAPHECEPFEIARIEFDRRGRSRFFSFCKTNLQPYDVCVKIALIIFAHHLGDDIVVGSDAGEADWDAAK